MFNIWGGQYKQDNVRSQNLEQDFIKLRGFETLKTSQQWKPVELNNFLLFFINCMLIQFSVIFIRSMIDPVHTIHPCLEMLTKLKQMFNGLYSFLKMTQQMFYLLQGLKLKQKYCWHLVRYRSSCHIYKQLMFNSIYNSL